MSYLAIRTISFDGVLSPCVICFVDLVKVVDVGVIWLDWFCKV
jgi:hypothetical protein